MKQTLICLGVSLIFSFSNGQRNKELYDRWNSIKLLNSIANSNQKDLKEKVWDLNSTITERGSQDQEVKILKELKELVKATNDLISVTDQINNTLITKTGGMDKMGFPIAFKSKKQKIKFLTPNSQEHNALEKQVRITNESYLSSIKSLEKLGISYNVQKLELEIKQSSFMDCIIKIKIIQTSFSNRSLQLIETTNSHFSSHKIDFDELFIGFESNSKTIFEGDTLTGRIELVAISSKLEQNLYVNGIKLKSNNYQAIGSTEGCKLVENNLYECEVNSEVEIIRKSMPPVKLPKVFKYYVLKK